MAHHRLFERVGTYDTMIIRLTLTWLFTVAFLPFPTAILADQSGHAASTLYIGTLLLSSLALSLALASTATWVSAHPALQRTAEPDATVEEPHWTTAALFMVGLRTHRAAATGKSLAASPAPALRTNRCLASPSIHPHPVTRDQERSSMSQALCMRTAFPRAPRMM